MKLEASLASRPIAAPRPAALRSKVTNGKSLFAVGGDMRGPWARRLRDVFELHLSDLGPDNVSEAERSIVRRAAVLTVELERIESRFALDKGSNDDLDLYQRTAGNLRRLLESVGLERRPRDVTPSLAEYLASRAEETPSDTGEGEPGADLAPEVETLTGGPPSEQGEPLP
jgi:hypothetical protein